MKAVLFDLDGTLLDTAPDLGAALNRVLAAEQRPLVTAAEYTPIASHGSAGLLRYAYGDELDQRYDELRSAFLRHYADAIATHSRVFDGVNELLERLIANDFKVAIVTNKPGHLTAQVLPYFPTLHSIDVVVSGDTLAVAKPHPDPLLHAADLLAVSPAQCWYVGDAERDIAAGRAAGMKTVLASYGYISTTDQPEQWQADYQIEQPLNLLELVCAAK